MNQDYWQGYADALATRVVSTAACIHEMTLCIAARDGLTQVEAHELARTVCVAARNARVRNR